MKVESWSCLEVNEAIRMILALDLTCAYCGNSGKASGTIDSIDAYDKGGMKQDGMKYYPGDKGDKVVWNEICKKNIGKSILRTFISDSEMSDFHVFDIINK